MFVVGWCLILNLGDLALIQHLIERLLEDGKLEVLTASPQSIMQLPTGAWRLVNSHKALHHVIEENLIQIDRILWLLSVQVKDRSAITIFGFYSSCRALLNLLFIG